MSFGGFPVDALVFFEGLEADNSKTYWQDHKATYESAVDGPMKELVAAVAEEFGELNIFRPYRDVRFSKDKSPYKTNVGAASNSKERASLYVALSSEGLYAGTGYYQLAKDQLDRFRQAVDRAGTGTELERIVVVLREKGFDVSGQSLKRAPRGFPVDHPRIALLRHTGVYAGRHFDPGPWLHTRASLDEVTDTWRSARPLVDWLETHVGPSTLPPDTRR